MASAHNAQHSIQTPTACFPSSYRLQNRSDPPGRRPFPPFQVPSQSVFRTSSARSGGVSDGGGGVVFALQPVQSHRGAPPPSACGGCERATAGSRRMEKEGSQRGSVTVTWLDITCVDYFQESVTLQHEIS